MLPVRVPPAIAKLRRAGEYDVPIPPGEGIWGGMMLPDSLPLLDNGGGDALLLRFFPDGTAREVVEWRHEECAWHPSDLVPGLTSPDDARRRGAERVLRPGVAEWCMQHGGASLAERVGVPWSTLAHGLDDIERLDADLRWRIAEALGQPPGKLFAQDWARAAESARGVQRTDLAWPGAVIGRAEEVRGDVDAAIAAYRRSLDGFRSTAAFTAGWDIAARMARLGERVEPGDPAAVRARWMDLGRAHLDGGRPMEAYDAFFRAGWDNLYTNDIAEVLDHLIQAAEAAGSAALAGLARLHRASSV